MGLLSRGLVEQKAADPLELWAEIARTGRKSKSGATVNLESAFRVSVVFACLRVLSQGCAQVPFKLFRSVESNGLEKIVPARDHKLYDVVTVAPNAWTSSFEFRETMVIHAALGNAYAFKVLDPRGELIELILLDPSKVKKVQDKDWSIRFELHGDTGIKVLPADAIWHVRGPSWNGVVGMDILNLAREALGLAIATEESHGKIHAKGVQTSGVYSVDGTLSPKQYAELKAWIEKEHVGADNFGAPMILDRGAKWVQMSMTGKDSQHLETRKHQIEEICRYFGVMPIMIGYSDKATTYASAEQMFLAHVVHGLAPWFSRIEGSADLHLLSKKERSSGLYFKFMAGGLLRGASKDRAEYLSRALGAGGSPAWMTQDEVRALEELNPMGGDAGQLPMAPSAPQP